MSLRQETPVFARRTDQRPKTCDLTHVSTSCGNQRKLGYLPSTSQHHKTLGCRSLHHHHQQHPNPSFLNNYAATDRKPRVPPKFKDHGVNQPAKPRGSRQQRRNSQKALGSSYVSGSRHQPTSQTPGFSPTAQKQPENLGFSRRVMSLCQC